MTLPHTSAGGAYSNGFRWNSVGFAHTSAGAAVIRKVLFCFVC